ncbi:MAG: type II toxin-antitoxin system VapC family toxin [Solirubrobacterales bacterium]|nr:type II toxin-antitoxin system VapC family toxin [Solirubrobacterales bacterium]
MILSLVGKGSDGELIRDRVRSDQLHAPHLIDAEVGNVLRGHERAGLINPSEARAALRLGPALIEYRYPHSGQLAERAWELRHNLSFYDALYVALAARLEIPLVTADRRLGRAPRLPCEVQLIADDR